MSNTLKKRTPGFQKGEVGNPTGRPVGCYSTTKRKFLEVQKKAAGDADKIYEEIREKMLAGESWAYQIYYKEHYSLPKKYKEDTITLPKINDEESGNINTRLKLLIQALDQFEDYSYDEVLGAIKALASVKSNEVIENQTEHVRQTREELSKKIENITQIMDYMKKEKDNGCSIKI